MKKFLLLIIILIFNSLFGFCQENESLKIVDINFDNSENIIFFPCKNGQVESIKDLKITSGKLTNPNRVYFDINNAIITFPSANYEIKTNRTSRLTISQNTLNPDVVRIVLYSDNLDISQFQAIKVKNGLIFKFNDKILTESSLHRIFREEKKLSSDFFEKFSFTKSSLYDKKYIQNNTESEKFINVQKSFNKLAPQNDINEGNETTLRKIFGDTASYQAQIIQSNQKLNSKYYINRIDIKNQNVLISGTGKVAVERPFGLNDPKRIVFDIPNAILNPTLHNQQYQISQQESVKIAQLERNKVRIVISTPYIEKYLPIFSTDLQCMLIANEQRLGGIKLFDQVANLTNIKLKNKNDNVDELILQFDSPIIHSFRKLSDKLELTLYNFSYPDIQKIQKALQNSSMKNIGLYTYSYSNIRIVIPVNPGTNIDYYETVDAKKLYLIIKNGNKNTQEKPPIIENTQGLDNIQQLETNSKTNTSSILCRPQKKKKNIIIVLDAGHGGNDAGATRSGIDEKDINLDVTKKMASLLTKKGYKVEMTRWQDIFVSLADRVSFSDSKNAAIFVSVHVNSSVSESPYGVETHYYKDNSMELAQIIQKHISQLPTANRGILKSKFYVINHTTAPAVLVEIGFISNPKERNQLITQQRKQLTAQYIVDGIIEYLEH